MLHANYIKVGREGADLLFGLAGFCGPWGVAASIIWFGGKLVLNLCGYELDLGDNDDRLWDGLIRKTEETP